MGLPIMTHGAGSYGKSRVGSFSRWSEALCVGIVVQVGIDFEVSTQVKV